MTDMTVGAHRERIHSIDRLRGLVMIIMALDHVRDYYAMTAFAPEDLSQTDPAYFFTRWITHFCAPVFVFLSGVSAYLHQANKNLSRKELSLFLLTRGIWLILLEITLITFFWQFGYGFVILQVIWAIGWSMVLLSALIFLPRPAILGIGLVLIIGHNALDGVQPAQFGDWGWLWNVLHVQTFMVQTSMGVGAFVGYPLIPWIGVCAAGYGLGAVFEQPAAVRHRSAVLIGAGCVLVFLVLRGFNLYGEPGIGPADAAWTDHGRGAFYAFLSFINTTKYPPSLLFLLMTIGPSLMLLPLLERWNGRVADVFTVFGRVPFLFYIMHLPLIHATSLLWNKLAYGQFVIQFFNPATWPESYSPNLLIAYVVWVLVAIALYWPCRAFMNYRKTHRQWWLSYL